MDLFPYFPIDSTKIILNNHSEDYVQRLVNPSEYLDQEIESRLVIDEINKFMAEYQKIHIDREIADMSEFPLYEGEPVRENSPQWIAWARKNTDLYYEADFFLDIFDSVLNDCAHESRKKHPSWEILKTLDIQLILGGLSEYFQYLPYINHGFDPTRKFKSLIEKINYKNKIYKELMLRDNDDLVEFVDNVDTMSSLAALAGKRVRDIDDKLIWFGVDLPERKYKTCRMGKQPNYMELDVHKTKEALETLWLDVNHPDYPPELLFASLTWSAIYQHSKYPRVSHSRAVEQHLKKFDIPDDQRFIDRVTSLTTPARLKTGEWKKFDPYGNREKK